MKYVNQDQFKKVMTEGYACQGQSLRLGNAILDKMVTTMPIALPLSTLNRHGLIAGATGTGKTKTIQMLAEGLSKAGVPVLLMDLKGDLSGLGAAGEKNAAITKRHQALNLPFNPQSYPVNLLSLSNEKGAKLRATVSEFGPVLFSKILELNPVQSSIVAMIFKYCDDNDLPLLDLKDFKKTLHFITYDGKDAFQEVYGRISKTSAGTILRRIIALEQQGAAHFFGEPSFDVEDLVQYNDAGQGYISILRLIDLQTRPKIFSTFMLCLLAEIYEKFPEVGDMDAPKLVIFIDEAHLLFKKAPAALLNQIEMTIKLIRSKGIGIYFCTQNPNDVPAAVLSQLGLKIQHALRAFTAKDRKALKLAAENYPSSPFYTASDLMTSLGIGEAAITALNENGQPTPLAATLLRAPKSRMGPLAQAELQNLLKHCALTEKYNQVIDRESAYEILSHRLENAKQAAPTASTSKRKPKKESGLLEGLSSNAMVKQAGRTLVRELVRGLFGILSGKK